MSEIEKMKRYIERTEKLLSNTPYQMNLSQMFTLADVSKTDVNGAICLAFNYGRAKGYRAAKAERGAKA